MLTVKKAAGSSVGLKFLMALSGFALIGFVIMHLAGNLTLYFPNSVPFNTYVHKLHSMGELLEAAEAGLVVLFVLHIFLALRITLKNKSARDQKYAKTATKGGPSKSTVGSRNMIITGLILLAFLILHLWQFHFGPGMEQGYVTQIDGHDSRDLYRLVFETFHNPLYVGIYVAVMVFLGFHLRHGFWSAFQSLGALNPRTTKLVYALGLLIAVVVAAGFLFIPLWIYFGGAK